MSKQEDGGPAFPVAHPLVTRGMSLRDWFAGQAMIGMLANPRSVGHANASAEDAYRIADAMLEARKK